MLVLGAAAEPIPLPLRREWMRERHPGARVIAGWDELPIDFDDPHVHDLHIALMERLLNEPIDAVFTGEAYGDLLAERWGVEHVCQPRGGRDLRDRGARRPGGVVVVADPARPRLPVPARRDHRRGVDGDDDARPRPGGAARHGLGAGGGPRGERGARAAVRVDRHRLRGDRPPPAARRGSRRARSAARCSCATPTRSPPASGRSATWAARPGRSRRSRRRGRMR